MGFCSSSSLLNTRFKSIKEALLHKNNVLDRSIYEDSLFTQINYEQGNITEEEMNIYNSLLENMMEEIDGMQKISWSSNLFKRIIWKTHTTYKKIGNYEQEEKQVEYFKLT